MDCGKKKIGNYVRARKVAKAQSQRHGSGGKFRAYWCNACEAYHTGTALHGRPRKRMEPYKREKVRL